MTKFKIDTKDLKLTNVSFKFSFRDKNAVFANLAETRLRKLENGQFRFRIDTKVSKLTNVLKAEISVISQLF